MWLDWLQRLVTDTEDDGGGIYGKFWFRKFTQHIKMYW